jgi:hypothetical protein
MALQSYKQLQTYFRSIKWNKTWSYLQHIQIHRTIPLQRSAILRFYLICCLDKNSSPFIVKQLFLKMTDSTVFCPVHLLETMSLF